VRINIVITSIDTGRVDAQITLSGHGYSTSLFR
jgi:hypothetical protein